MYMNRVSVLTVYTGMTMTAVNVEQKLSTLQSMSPGHFILKLYLQFSRPVGMHTRNKLTPLLTTKPKYIHVPYNAE